MVAMDTDMKALMDGLGSYIKLSPSAKSHQCKCGNILYNLYLEKT